MIITQVTFNTTAGISALPTPLGGIATCTLDHQPDPVWICNVSKMSLMDIANFIPKLFMLEEEVQRIVINFDGREITLRLSKTSNTAESYLPLIANQLVLG